jgi:hypothetical protein
LLLEHVEPVVADVPVARDEPAEVLAEQPLRRFLGAPGVDPVAHERGGRRGPQPARVALGQPCRLVRVYRLRELDRLCQLAPRVVQNAAHAADHRVDRADADRDPVGLGDQLADRLARQPAPPREHRDMRMQSEPELALRHAGRQLGQHRPPTPRARQPQPPPLAHLRHDQRHIPLLMRDRLPDPPLLAGEPVPAPAAPGHALDRPTGQLVRPGRLAAGALMTGLCALLATLATLTLQLLLRALTRELPTLLTRQRRIRRRRQRTVTRIAAQLPPEFLDLLPQPRHLVERVEQHHDQLARGLPSRHRDHLGSRSIHERKIPFAEKEPCRSRRHPVNAYQLHAVGSPRH